MNSLLQFAPLLMGMPASDPAGGSGQLFTTFITFGLVIAIFYFLIIRPQSKRQKETKRMLEAVKKGDRVVTIGGIRGTIISVKGDIVVLRVDTNTKLEVSKSAVSQIVAQEEKKAQKKKSEETTVDADESPETDVEDESGGDT